MSAAGSRSEGEIQSDGMLLDTTVVTIGKRPKRGDRIAIWWSEDKCYYPGVVAQFDSTSMKHFIKYDDGDKEYLDLTQERWKRISPVNPMPIADPTTTVPQYVPPSSSDRSQGVSSAGVHSPGHRNKNTQLISEKPSGLKLEKTSQETATIFSETTAKNDALQCEEVSKRGGPANSAGGTHGTREGREYSPVVKMETDDGQSLQRDSFYKRRMTVPVISSLLKGDGGAFEATVTKASVKSFHDVHAPAPLEPATETPSVGRRTAPMAQPDPCAGTSVQHALRDIAKNEFVHSQSFTQPDSTTAAIRSGTDFSTEILARLDAMQSKLEKETIGQVSNLAAEFLSIQNKIDLVGASVHQIAADQVEIKNSIARLTTISDAISGQIIQGGRPTPAASEIGNISYDRECPSLLPPRMPSAPTQNVLSHGAQMLSPLPWSHDPVLPNNAPDSISRIFNRGRPPVAPTSSMLRPRRQYVSKSRGTVGIGRHRGLIHGQTASTHSRHLREVLLAPFDPSRQYPQKPVGTDGISAPATRPTFHLTGRSSGASNDGGGGFATENREAGPTMGAISVSEQLSLSTIPNLSISARDRSASHDGVHEPAEAAVQGDSVYREM